MRRDCTEPAENPPKYMARRGGFRIEPSHYIDKCRMTRVFSTILIIFLFADLSFDFLRHIFVSTKERHGDLFFFKEHIHTLHYLQFL